MLSKHDLEQWDILSEIEYGYYDDHYGIGEGDIEFLLSTIGSEPKNILEVCCGSGRIFIPLAKAGHKMTGVDAHYGMLSRLHQKAKGLQNVKYYYSDALRHEFETGFDVVLVAFNVIQNIEHIDNCDPAQELADYTAAQEMFISKAAKSVIQGGHLFFAFELFTNQSASELAKYEAKYEEELTEYNKKRTVVYVLTANFASLILGGTLISHLPV